MLVILNKAFGNAHSNVAAARLNLEEVQQRPVRWPVGTRCSGLRKKTAVLCSWSGPWRLRSSCCFKKSRTKMGYPLVMVTTPSFSTKWRLIGTTIKILAIQNGPRATLWPGSQRLLRLRSNTSRDLLGTSNPNFSYLSMQHTIDSMQCNVIPDHKLNALTEFVSPDLIFKTLKIYEEREGSGSGWFSLLNFYIACWPTIQFWFLQCYPKLFFFV